MTLKMKLLVKPIIGQIYRKDYLMLMKTMFHNISFNDMQDELFLFDFPLRSKLSGRVKKRKEVKV